MMLEACYGNTPDWKVIETTLTGSVEDLWTCVGHLQDGTLVRVGGVYRGVRGGRAYELYAPTALTPEALQGWFTTDPISWWASNKFVYDRMALVERFAEVRTEFKRPILRALCAAVEDWDAMLDYHAPEILTNAHQIAKTWADLGEVSAAYTDTLTQVRVLAREADNMPVSRFSLLLQKRTTVLRIRTLWAYGLLLLLPDTPTPIHFGAAGILNDIIAQLPKEPPPRNYVQEFISFPDVLLSLLLEERL